MAVEYMTFQEVLEELQIDEEELKRLVSNAELRGFRAGSSMKFKRDDVMSLKQGRETEPTIILTDSDQEMGIAESSDELILEDSTSDTVIHIGDIMGGARSGSQQEIIFDTTEEYTVSPHDSEIGGDPESVIPTVEVPSISEDMGLVESESDAALVEVGSDESMETEAFELMDESGETDTDGMAVAAAAAPGAAAKSGRTSRRGMSQSARMRAMEIEQKQGHAFMTSLLLLGLILLSLQFGILFSEVNESSPKWALEVTSPFTSMVESLYASFN
ncbi:MAG: DNA-binding protein [Planctomycetota bacterium]|nr:MAG: DNA-binding protein [Planctomycetota bacterium]